MVMFVIMQTVHYFYDIATIGYPLPLGRASCLVYASIAKKSSCRLSGRIQPECMCKESNLLDGYSVLQTPPQTVRASHAWPFRAHLRIVRQF
jgi:hypothetical protein